LLELSSWPGAVTEKVTKSPFDPLVQALFPRLARRVPRWVSPNAITVAGLVATVGAGSALALAGGARWLLFVAAGLVLVNWAADTLDGIVARQRKQTSRLGDFLDHAFDAMAVAALTIGPALSGLVHPALALLHGVLTLVCFALTYKGEQATDDYELLAFGPTEVRFALTVVFVAAYFLPGSVVAIAGYPLQVLDLSALVGSLWAVVYGTIVFARYARRLRRLDRPSDGRD